MSCVDCGKPPYTRDDNGDEICRDCHGDRVNFIARNQWARRNVLSYYAEDFMEERREALWSAEHKAQRVKEAPMRELVRQCIRDNLAAYAAGTFPGDRSLVRGHFEIEDKWREENP